MPIWIPSGENLSFTENHTFRLWEMPFECDTPFYRIGTLSFIKPQSRASQVIFGMRGLMFSVMRPLWAEYPEDVSVFAEQNEFLVGKDLLVKPVTRAGQKTVDIYFPGLFNRLVDLRKLQETNFGTTSLQISNILNQELKLTLHWTRFQFFSEEEVSSQRKREHEGQALKWRTILSLWLLLWTSSKVPKENYTWTMDTRSTTKNPSTWGRSSDSQTMSWLPPVSKAEPSKVVPQSRELLYLDCKNNLPRSLSAQGQQTPLEFTYKDEKLTIRKPDVNISEDWSITLS